jgi:C4-dicarboxylate transporter DctQ subunit
MRIIKDFDYMIQPILVIAMLLALGAQVLYRFVPNLSIPWTLELITFLFGASIWFGISIAIKEDAHVGITFIINRLPARAKKIVKIAHNIMFGSFIIFLGWFGTNSLLYYLEKEIRTPAMQISYFIARLPLFFGCIFSLYRLVEKTVSIARMDEAEIESL